MYKNGIFEKEKRADCEYDMTWGTSLHFCHAAKIPAIIIDSDIVWVLAYISEFMVTT